MDTWEQIQWFEDNLEVVRVFTGMFFALEGIGEAAPRRWLAGYAYDEPYDGRYFFDCLSSGGNSLRDAVASAYEKSALIVSKLDRILKEAQRSSFEVAHSYTIVRVTNDGIQFADVVYNGTDSTWGDTRIRYEFTEAPHSFLLDEHDLKRVFVTIPQELR